MEKKNQGLVKKNQDLKEVEGVKEVLKNALELVKENQDLRKIGRSVKEVLKKVLELVKENQDQKNQ